MLSKQFDKVKVESAIYHLVTYEGQMTVNPKPLAEVRLRDDARKACWQLLGPPPEKKEAFNTNPDGSPRQGKKATSPASAPEPSEKPKPVRNEPPAKKPRKKKGEQETSAAANRPAADASSIMAQYRAAKEKHPDMMLLFRIGDFYELFGEDAETAHKLLGLTLTTRDQTHTMAGFPHHQLEAYLQKLLKDGKRVAICDQVDDSLARGPIKREVQRIVTPANDGE